MPHTRQRMILLEMYLFAVVFAKVPTSTHKNRILNE